MREAEATGGAPARAGFAGLVPLGRRPKACNLGSQTRLQNLAVASPCRLRQQPPRRRAPHELALCRPATSWKTVPATVDLRESAAVTAGEIPRRGVMRGRLPATFGPLRSSGDHSTKICSRAAARGEAAAAGGRGVRPRDSAAALAPEREARGAPERRSLPERARPPCPPAARSVADRCSSGRTSRCYDRALRGGDLVSTEWLSCTSGVPRFQEASQNTWKFITANNSYSLAA